MKIHSLYGTTETGSITFDSSDTLSDRVTVGWPMPETTVTLDQRRGRPRQAVASWYQARLYLAAMPFNDTRRRGGSGVQARRLPDGGPRAGRPTMDSSS